MKSFENICYTKMGLPEQMLDIHIPDLESFPVFIYFHGGGIEHGDKAADRNVFIEPLVNKGVAVVSANYRMYPEAVYPEFIRDAATAVAWTISNMKDYGNPSAFFVGGSSAGGYLSQMLCFDKKYLAPYKINPDEIAGFIHDAGQPTTHFNVLRERGIDSRRVIIDEAAPLYHICGDRNYAPMQIFYAEHDMENRPEQTKLLVSTLKHFKCNMDKVDVRYMEGFTHCKYNKANDENGENVFAKAILEFIDKYKGDK